MRGLGRSDEAKLLGISKNLSKCGISETYVSSDRTWLLSQC